MKFVKLAERLKFTAKMETLRRTASWTSRRRRSRKGSGSRPPGGSLRRRRSSSEDRDLPPRTSKLINKPLKEKSYMHHLFSVTVFAYR